MGIDVSDQKVVTYNPTHQKRVNTDVTRAPPREVLGSLDVVSIFRRLKVRVDEQDGNPLIYALKGKFGYTIPYGSFRQILVCAQQILPGALAPFDYDVVVPLPSSSKVAEIFAKRASRLQGNCPIISCFEKATFAQVLASAPAVQEVEKRLRRDFKSQLHALQGNSPDHIFEMKKVKMSLRHHFNPLVANAQVQGLAGAKVLFIDDILGSGASLIAASNALRPYGPAAMAGLTFLARLS